MMPMTLNAEKPKKNDVHAIQNGHQASFPLFSGLHATTSTLINK